MAWHTVSCKEEFNVSNGSTVEENSSNENNSIEASEAIQDEPFTFLQGLNSENLMQFSQQSAIHELMQLERNDIKPKVNTLPTLENHDYGGYNFKMSLSQPNRSSWVYSEALNKIYIRMNQTFNIDVEFIPKMPIQPLRLRGFACFTNEVSEPVLRCQNHLCKDNAKDQNLLYSLLRSENPYTEYCGSVKGKSIIDRLSVLVPLTMVTSKDDKTVRQTTAFKFTCQNSCFGRKETSLIFCLEDMNGEILGQRVIHVKICSCPRRDKRKEERQLKSLHPVKRKLKDDDLSCSDFEECGSEEEFEIYKTRSGRFRLVLDCIDKDQLMHYIDRILENTAAATMLREDSRAELYRNQTRKLLELKKRAKRIE